MQRLYRWIGVWDAAGIAAREKDLGESTGMVPLGNVEWIKPPKRKPTASFNASQTSAVEVDSDVENMRMHPSAFVRPAWPENAPLVFSMSEIAWATIADSQKWLESDGGKGWLLGAVSYTLLALDS
jgi:hypothetical protein